MKPKSPHMSPEEFKANGYAFIDWIAKYYEEVEAYPVMSQVSPGAIAAKLPSEAPEHPESLAAVLEDMGDIIVPGLTHWASPNFFRILSIQCVSTIRTRRFTVEWLGNTRNALGHKSCGDRTRNKGDGLAGCTVSTA